MISISLEKYTGCLLGGAIGDALGAPVEFMSLEAIRSIYGENGIDNLVEFPGNIGEFTDDTQMTLFTAEALLRAYHRAALKGIGGALNKIAHNSYLRWLYTQGYTADKNKIRHSDYKNGWLINQKELYKKRAPGNTCLAALSEGIAGSEENQINNSKGCGTIMRVAPIGLFFYGDNKSAFKVACELSAITHGHPTGWLSAGVLSSVISDLAKGLKLDRSINNAVKILKTCGGNEETLKSILKCLDLYNTTKNNKNNDPRIIETLGGGWVAEEAMAISLYCSLIYENNFKSGVLLAVNHSGDSDSTGAITGNILGVINGESSIPQMWIKNLRYNHLVRTIAEDLHTRIKGNTYNPNDEWWERYPGN